MLTATIHIKCFYIFKQPWKRKCATDPCLGKKKSIKVEQNVIYGLTERIKVEEKNFFYLLWNYKTCLFGFFFVLVKYLQLWSTVQCLRIKFTAFRDSRDKKKNRKSTPKSQSAINTCCMFLIAASIHITRFITSRNTNRFIRKKTKKTKQ